MRIPILIVFISLVIRIVLLVVWPGVVDVSTDFDRYERLAISLLHAEGLSIDEEPTASVAPVYPAFIAMVYGVFGENQTALRFILAFLDSVQCGVFSLIALRHFGRLTSALCGLFLATCPYLIIHLYWLTAETLWMFLIAWFLYIWSIALAHEKVSSHGIAGFIAGATSLCRPTTLLLPLFLVPVFWVRYSNSKKTALVSFLCFGLGAFLAVGPWIARNYVQFQHFIPVQTMGGLHLYLATEKPVETTGDPGKDMNDIDLYRGAWENIVNDIPGYLDTVVRRLFGMWYRTHTDRLQAYLIPVNFSLLGLAALGFMVNRASWRETLYLSLFVLYFVCIHAVIYAIFRYMLPTIPVLAIFASSFVAYVLSGIFNRWSFTTTKPSTPQK